MTSDYVSILNLIYPIKRETILLGYIIIPACFEFYFPVVGF